MTQTRNPPNAARLARYGAGKVGTMEPAFTTNECVEHPERIVCRCLQVTECALIEVLRALPIQTLRDLRRHTGAGDGCTCCHQRLKAIIEQHNYASSDPICSCK